MVEPSGPSASDAGAGPPCDSLQQDLLLYLYEDLPPARHSEIRVHLGTCGRCREELESFRATLGAVDAAGLFREATVEDPGSWAALERRIRLSEGNARRGLPPAARFLLRAAAIVAVAALAFIAGRRWDTLEPQLAGVLPGALRPVEALPPPHVGRMESQSALQVFSRRTNDYLDRSKLVLLEFANTEEALDSPALRQASRNLAQESRVARRVAGEVADRRLEDLVTELGRILLEISRLSGPKDMATINRIRADLDASGLLDRLEIMSAGAPHVPQGRRRV